MLDVEKSGVSTGNGCHDLHGNKPVGLRGSVGMDQARNHIVQMNSLKGIKKQKALVLPDGLSSAEAENLVVLHYSLHSVI